VELPDGRYLPDSLNTILKYSGKTNEQFTRLMVNLARSLCIAEPHVKSGETFTLFDPLAGKGTTLFEGLIQGLDIAGIEQSAKLWQESCVFIVKYLERGRYKHKAENGKRSAPNGKKLADSFRLTLSNGAEAWKAGKMRELSFYCGDTHSADKLFKPASFDMLVTDLPYGIQHNVGRGQAPARGRATAVAPTTSNSSTLTLLREALPAWLTLLKPNAGIVMSFNAFSLKREGVAALLTQYGCEVMEEPPFDGYEHRVDQAIQRDVVTAKKK